jgi:hypothetical protein
MTKTLSCQRIKLRQAGVPALGSRAVYTGFKIRRHDLQVQLFCQLAEKHNQPEQCSGSNPGPGTC